MLLYWTLCVTMRAVVYLLMATLTRIQMEKDMSKALSKARPIVEATLVSLVLVMAALAVPIVILYAAV